MAQKKEIMSEFNLVTAKLHLLYLDQMFLVFITDIASPVQKFLSHSQLKDKKIDNVNTHRKKIPMGHLWVENTSRCLFRAPLLIYLKQSMWV